MSEGGFLNKVVSDWFTKIATTFIAMLLLSATLGTFAMAEEFISLKQTVVQLNDRMDNFQERLRYLERRSELTLPYAQTSWEVEE